MSESLSWMQTGDTLALSGELDQDVLLPLWEMREEAVKGITSIDLSRVSRVDTGGLALLLHLIELAKKQGAETIVCGLPVNFDGSESVQTVKTREFIEQLKALTEIPIETQDERFSTLQSRRLLLEADMRREKRKDVIDKIAASYILEDYLAKKKRGV